jgi:Zn-dependent oligopeptidase
MPEGFISTLEKVTPSPASQDIPKGKQNTTHVQEKTLYKIDLTYPKVGPFLKYSSNRVLKKELADKNNRKGGKISLKYIEKMVKLRVQITKILGYENYVDFKVEERMAKNNVTVQKFLVNAKKEILPAGKKDLKELKDFAKEKLNLKKLEYFDLAYASNKLYESKYSIDEKSVKEYFEMNHTLEFMFKYFGEIFGFEAVEEKDLQKEMWHPEVKVIKLQDSKKKNLLGYLLLDLYPREGKFNHMASFDTKYNTKMNTLVCNFQKPSETSPSLLTPHEVETLFHEFGHALHFLFSNTKHLSQNSFSFAWDIVELPSQMLENFFYNESILSKLSKHYKSGKSLDKKTIEKIISAKNFQNGYVYTRQIVMTELDLDIHLQKVKNKYEEYYKSLVKKYTSLGTGKDSLFPAGFGHLSGYDAGYYSYLWAQIYALDVYDQFAQHITNKTELKKLGRKYREEILEVGTSRKESDSIKAFLGRDVNAKVIKNLFN